jgi:phosphonate transport system substrate-binding protein
MTRDLGEEVAIKTQVMSGYKKGLESLVIGEVDFARLGPASYVMGKRENPDITLLSLESEKGAIAFDGVIVVRDDTDITEVAHLKGRTFAFGSERSTLGRYFAQTYLADVGIHAKDLGDYDYLSHHEAVGLAVGAGRYEAGVLNRRKFEELQRRGVRLREIASFENVTRAWVARSGLEPRVQASLRAALLSIEDPAVLQALGFDGFLPGRDVDFDKTRRALVDYAQFQE